MPNKTVFGRLEDSSQNSWLASLCGGTTLLYCGLWVLPGNEAAVLTEGISFPDERMLSISKVKAGLGAVSIKEREEEEISVMEK